MNSGQKQRSFGAASDPLPEGWQSLVECTGLENQHTFTGIVGSNPTPSASKEAPSTKVDGASLFLAKESLLSEDENEEDPSERSEHGARFGKEG